MHAHACRLQGKGDMRWSHPEDMTWGAGDTLLGYLLDEKVGMVLFRERV